MQRKNITVIDSENGSVKSNLDSALARDAVSLTITPNEFYKVSKIYVYKSNDKSIEIEVKDNSFIMPDYDVTVEVEFEKLEMNYSVTYELENLTRDGESFVKLESDYKTTLIPISGYKLPAAITIKIEDQELTGYTYNNETGMVVIPESIITGDIEIIATAVIQDSDNVDQSTSIPPSVDVENPNTFDDIERIFLIGIISLIGMISAIFCLSKNNIGGA